MYKVREIEYYSTGRSVIKSPLDRGLKLSISDCLCSFSTDYDLNHNQVYNKRATIENEK